MPRHPKPASPPHLRAQLSRTAFLCATVGHGGLRGSGRGDHRAPLHPLGRAEGQFLFQAVGLGQQRIQVRLRGDHQGIDHPGRVAAERQLDAVGTGLRAKSPGLPGTSTASEPEGRFCGPGTLTRIEALPV